jgi:hypothetical protein
VSPRLVAVYGRRHEPQWLIDDLVKNLAQFADRIVCVDDRGRSRAEAWGHEGQFRARQRDAAMAAGADWILVVDADERLEDRAGDVIRPLMEGPDAIYRLALREMYAPAAYRIDGKWGLVRRARLYPARPGQQMSEKPIHAPPVPIHTGLPKLDLDLNLYHLKMIEPANRRHRARAYALAEHQHGVRRRQWGALSLTAGMRLQVIPPGREFSPGYTRPYLVEAR